MSSAELELSHPGPVRVAVTGASGFVGSALVDRLAEDGQQVIALSRNPAKVPANAEWRPMADLSEDRDRGDELRGAGVVVHCAARVHVMRDKAADPLESFREINRRGTMSLAKAASLEGVRHFIFVSSIKVNGEHTRPGHPFAPQDAAKPQDPYGLSKAEAEADLREIGHETGMTITIVRPVLVYGPGVRANFAALAKLARSGLPIPLGSVENRRSLIYLGNLVDLLAKLVSGELPGGRVYLPSDGDPVSTAQLVGMMARAQARPARIIPFPTKLMRILARSLGRADVAERLLGDLEVDSRHLNALGWSPPYSTDEGVRCTLRNFT